MPMMLRFFYGRLSMMSMLSSFWIGLDMSRIWELIWQRVLQFPFIALMKTLHTSEILACTVKEFPCTYLGFLLTVRNVSRLNCYLFEKIADNFLGWKASLMNRAGLLIMVRVVMTDTPISLKIALGLPNGWPKPTTKTQRPSLERSRNKPMEVRR